MKGEKFSRVLRLLLRLQSGQSFTVDKLARTLGIARRTVFRDLKVLRDNGVRFYYDARTCRYRMDKGIVQPWLNLDKRQALGLLLRTLKSRDHTRFPFRRSASDAAAKILVSLPAEIRNHCNAVLGNIFTKPHPHLRTDPPDSIFELFQQAILKKQIVSIDYLLPDKHMTIATDLYPQRLVPDSYRWHVIGWSSHHKAIHAFKVDHIKKLRVLNKCFFKEDNFGADGYLGRAWSMTPERRLYNVKLRFLPEIAHDVAEVQWHDTQIAAFEADGSAIIEFCVDGLGEITWWILGFGNRVEVLAPQTLRKRITEIARSIIDKYEQKHHPDIVSIDRHPHADIV